MKAVIQRVLDASCTVDGQITGKIDSGLLVYFGLDKGDEEWMLKPFLEKLVRLRIFLDENDKMNLSVLEKNRAILFISQFTLSADVYKGNRPSFDTSEEPSKAKELYLKGAEILKGFGLDVQLGVFGAHMAIRYLNDGPITFMLDSSKIKSIAQKVAKN